MKLIGSVNVNVSARGMWFRGVSLAPTAPGISLIACFCGPVSDKPGRARWQRQSSLTSLARTFLGAQLLIIAAGKVYDTCVAGLDFFNGLSTAQIRFLGVLGSATLTGAPPATSIGGRRRQPAQRSVWIEFNF